MKTPLILGFLAVVATGCPSPEPHAPDAGDGVDAAMPDATFIDTECITERCADEAGQPAPITVIGVDLVGIDQNAVEQDIERAMCRDQPSGCSDRPFTLHWLHIEETEPFPNEGVPFPDVLAQLGFNDFARLCLYLDALRPFEELHEDGPLAVIGVGFDPDDQPACMTLGNMLRQGRSCGHTAINVTNTETIHDTIVEFLVEAQVLNRCSD